MPEPAVVLDPGQAEDLHQFLDHADTVAQWLLHAADEILDDLAQTAYPAHFQPRSAVFWLIEDLVHIRYRLSRTLRPDPACPDAAGAQPAGGTWPARRQRSAPLVPDARPPRRR